jgi:hypothetical protein
MSWEFTAPHLADLGGNGAANFSFTLNFSDSSQTTVTGQSAPELVQ